MYAFVRWLKCNLRLFSENYKIKSEETGLNSI